MHLLSKPRRPSCLPQKVKNMGLDQVLVITDNLDENLWLSSRNLPNVLVLEAKEADPVSLGSLRQGAGDAQCRGQVRGDVGMNQERLMQVLLAPQVSEKATYVADKNEQVVFKVAADATKPEDQGSCRAAVQGRSRCCSSPEC